MDPRRAWADYPIEDAKDDAPMVAAPGTVMNAPRRVEIELARGFKVFLVRENDRRYTHIWRHRPSRVFITTPSGATKAILDKLQR